MTVVDRFRHLHGLTGHGLPLVSQSAGRILLAKLFHALGFTRGAEIGVWEGSYAKQLCEAIPGVELIGVDPWAVQPDYREVKNDNARLQAAYAKACEMLEPFNCRLMRMTSLEAAELVPDGSLDFVYIDGNHSKAFVDADLRAWTPKVRSGGIISGHDFQMNNRKPWIEVPQSVREFTAEQKIDPWYVLARDKSPSWFWVKA